VAIIYESIGISQLLGAHVLASPPKSAPMVRTASKYCGWPEFNSV